MDKQDRHWHETAFINQVAKYLMEAYGKTIEEIGISTLEILDGYNRHIFPNDFVDEQASAWGIKMRTSFIPHTARRIVHV